MAALISVKDITKEFASPQGPKVVLDHLDLDINPGELVCIMGHSGCGKTTLLHCLAGLTAPTSGSIHIAPHTTQSLVFQDPRLLPWKTVGENIALGLLHAPQVKDPIRAVQESLALVRLPQAADLFPCELSGGMAQRVGLARALAREPDILYLDEPFGALDALTRRQMQAELLRILQRRPVTTVFITHDVSEAVLVADRIVEIRAGKIARSWPVAFPKPRRMSDPGVAKLAEAILEELLGQDFSL